MTIYESATFQPDCSIGYLIRVINQNVAARLEPVITATGVSYIQWQVLVSLYFDRGPTCVALARDLAYDKGAMTRLIDGLEERGLVTRERASDDRRVVNIALTDDGRAAAERGRDGVIRCWNTWLADWDGGEARHLIAMLTRLRGTLEASEGCA